jgi:hypothetical protein
MLRMLTITGGRFAPVGATKPNPFASVAVRPPEVTTTSPVPAGPAPVIAVNAVEL